MSSKQRQNNEADRLDGIGSSDPIPITVIDIDEVHEDPANLRKHGPRNLAAIKSSLSRFGQQDPIIVDGDGIVRAGNGRLRAARELGWKTIECKRTDLTGSEAVAFAIASNRTAELADWDEPALAAMLQSLRSEDFPIEAAGYTDEEFDRFLEGLGGEMAGDEVDDPRSEWQGMPEFHHEDKTALQSISVHFKTREDVATFADLIGRKITDKTKSLWYPEAEIIRYGESE